MYDQADYSKPTGNSLIWFSLHCEEKMMMLMVVAAIGEIIIGFLMARARHHCQHHYHRHYHHRGNLGPLLLAPHCMYSINALRLANYNLLLTTCYLLRKGAVLKLRQRHVDMGENKQASLSPK